MKVSTASFKLRNPVHFLALGFGSGLAPKAPGTFGTLAGIPIFLVLAQFSLPVYLAVTALFFVVGIAICGVAARDAGVHDHPAIVWDEVVGFLITMIAVPAGWGWVILGFCLFRLFDILKPWPIRLLDRYVGGGFGIMIDDVLAGIFALAVLQLLLYWL
ncbi:phosphatidylglycerophosphatase A [Alkalilimnicola ehrlichii]|uniref:Phosphatidylglycerophosphatase A n=1 Tax=Alkalilimnicola ehrlichii TaxID=351052 RepID=A0A3E0WMW2_9GAMM|nr:phosphatidylglycerophosphatase A [Alkalilimnicola ehrlichii]RFA27018.1 phosphatidylglycerophosphatase A [Alkalilimnicola ehrlichii]RFA34138.1 phosphatidylglycerophosphatase A [Alkalilimnicola ehrlichii]